jgi:hypothetical protein
MSALRRKLSSDQRLSLWLVGTMVCLTFAIALLQPRSDEDTHPSTYNSGTMGLKASYLTLERIGVKVSRWTEPLDALDNLDARHTTLVLADPSYDGTDRKHFSDILQRFLDRGGRVLATGASGAELLPFGAVKPPGTFRSGLCTTTPEGPGELARAGRIEMAEAAQWAGQGPLFRVEQRCGADAVVVRYPEGQGEAIWWSTATPADNGELKNDPGLRLLLASIGTDRTVLFDEALHGVVHSPWDLTKSLPMGWLEMQALLVFALLVFSFSRRNGPLRMPLALPRTSPLEFATSMGDLYAKAGASSVAVEQARHQLLHALQHEAGLSAHALAGGWDAIVAELQMRFGGDWLALGDALATSEHVPRDLAAGSALRLVQALSDARAAVQQQASQRTRFSPSQAADTPALRAHKGEA